MNNGINLAINKKSPGNSLVNQLRILRFVAMGILGAVAVASMVLFFLIAVSPLPGLKKQENASLFQITQLHPKIAKYLLINERITSITELLHDRNAKSKSLQLIEDQIPSDTSVDSMKIDDKGLTVDASSTSLATINTFIANVIDQTGTDKSFSSVLLDSLAYDTKNQNYHISLSLTL